MSLSNNQAITNFNDGNKFYKANLFNEALEQYEKTIDNDPTFYNAHFCLAKTLVRLKKYENGSNHFKKYVHLIPKEKQGEYIIALSNILIDEQQQNKALLIIEALDVSFKESQIFNYVSILLSNNKTAKAIHSILQIEKAGFVAKEYKELLNNNSFTESAINDFSKENTIPRFYSSIKKLTFLKKMEIQNKDLKENIDTATTLIEIIRSKEDIDYSSKINDLENKIVTIQDIVSQHATVLLKTNKISSSKRILACLESTKYDTKKTQALAIEIKSIEKKNKNSRIKKVSIITGLILLISLSSYYGYNEYQKSEIFNKVITSNNINEYNSYLNKFGDNEEIHKLREEKLYQTAIESNRSNDIQSLISLYPKSKKLRSITFNYKYKNLIFYGANSINNKIHGSINSNTSTFKAPVGCKVGYSISEFGKIPVKKFFTVNKNLKINEELLESETLLLDENFDKNSSKWNVYSKSNTSRYGKKNIEEEISLQNNKLNLVNKAGNKKLVYSLIDIENFNKDIDYKITARINTLKYFTNGTYLMFGAKNRAFIYFGYSGTANNGTYSIGYNNWDDSTYNWKNWTNGWQGVQNTGYEATLKIEKRNNKLYFYINNVLYQEYTAKNINGSKIGFGINGGTKSSISYLKVEKLNKPKKVDFKLNNIYFCWVNELNIRSKGSNKGEILTTIKRAEPVKFLGEKGNKKVNATFNDKYSSDYYYKVELKDGTIGWVHGGALCEINAVDLNEKMTLNPVIKKETDTLQANNKIINNKYDYFIIENETNKETNSFKNIEAYIETTKSNLSVSKIIELNKIGNQESINKGDTIYLSEDAFSKHKQESINLSNKEVNEDDEIEIEKGKEEAIPFDFAEKAPRFGKCNGKSNATLSKCFNQNLSNYLQKEIDLKQYQTLGLANGIKKVKYQFTITQQGEPTNIKVWADHDTIVNDITSILENIEGFKPGELKGEKIDVTYNSILNIRIGEKPKKIIPKEKIEEPEPEPEKVVIPSNLTFHSVDRAPIFPGCESNSDAIMFSCSSKKINNYIQENINYKKISVKEDETYSAKVNASFNINTLGKTTKINVTCNSEIEDSIKQLIIEEIKRVINSIPTMQSALYSGIQVEVNFETTINFNF